MLSVESARVWGVGENREGEGNGGEVSECEWETESESRKRESGGGANFAGARTDVGAGFSRLREGSACTSMNLTEGKLSIDTLLDILKVNPQLQHLRLSRTGPSSPSHSYPEPLRKVQLPSLREYHFVGMPADNAYLLAHLIIPASATLSCRSVEKYYMSQDFNLDAILPRDCSSLGPSTSPLSSILIRTEKNLSRNLSTDLVIKRYREQDRGHMQVRWSPFGPEAYVWNQFCLQQGTLKDQMQFQQVQKLRLDIRSTMSGETSWCLLLRSFTSLTKLTIVSHVKKWPLDLLLAALGPSPRPSGSNSTVESSNSGKLSNPPYLPCLVHIRFLYVTLSQSDIDSLAAVMSFRKANVKAVERLRLAPLDWDSDKAPDWSKLLDAVGVLCIRQDQLNAK